MSAGSVVRRGGVNVGRVLAAVLLAMLVTGVSTRAQCPGDITGSGQVNVFDLLELLSCWGPVKSECDAADLDGDGSVNVFDLLGLLSFWGPCACVPDCDGVECGDDGCGGSCGSCSSGDCIEGECICIPDCSGAVCGDDGCGGSCGSCGVTEMCQDGQCVLAQGACCWPLFGDVCTISDKWTCGVDNSGAYAGDGTTCETFSCPTQQPGSCYGKCGSYATGCWCDHACTGHNDCCEDVCWCGNLSEYWWCD